MSRAVLISLFTVAAMLVTAAPSAACSSDGSADLRRALSTADGAFVGKLFKRHGRTLLHFRVQVRVKGRIGRKVLVHALRDCGPAVRRGRRVGLLLHRRHGRWEANAFDVVDAGELLNTAGLGP